MPPRSQRFYVSGYLGYVPQVKAENVFGKTYTTISGMSRQGKIETKANDANHNHFDNLRFTDKYKSIQKVEYRDAYKESKETKHHEVFNKGYDQFDYAESERQNVRESFPQKRHSSPKRTDGFIVRRRNTK